MAVIPIAFAVGIRRTILEQQRYHQHLRELDRDLAHRIRDAFLQQNQAEHARYLDRQRRERLETIERETFKPREEPMSDGAPILQPLLDARRRLSPTEIQERIQTTLTQKPKAKAKTPDSLIQAYNHFRLITDQMRQSDSRILALGAQPAIATAMGSSIANTSGWHNQPGVIINQSDASSGFITY